ncbi:MAG: mitochondrial fission ELM1 family protein [Gammaproteobacteria bacterium]
MTSLVAWCLFDGKPGHENQVMGLVNALGSLISLNPYFFEARTSILNWTLGRFPPGHTLPDPDLLVGAGHGTHIPLITARRVRGGRIVLLMNPSLPTAWFDMCIIPEHDQPRPASNILLSRGTLSRIRPCPQQHDKRGLVLIGGPSRNYVWSDVSVIEQVRNVIRANPDWRWTLTTSRRTPLSFLQCLHTGSGAANENLELPDMALDIVTWPDTGPEWVFEQLREARRVWVTEESVSMVYDALTVGAEVGLISVPKSRSGRVARGVQRLVEDGLVMPFECWRQGQELRPRTETFDEAARCALWVRDQCLSDH